MKNFHKIDFWLHNIFMLGILVFLTSTTINSQFIDNSISGYFLVLFVIWELLVIYFSTAPFRKIINITWFTFGFITIVASSYFFFGLTFITAPIMFLANLIYSWMEHVTHLDNNSNLPFRE